MADVIPTGILSLAGAQRVSETVLAAASSRDLSIAVAVCGPAGDLRAFARMDGASALAAETARRKCQTVALTGRPTRDLGARFKGYLSDEPQLFHGLLQIDNMAPFPGGVPIRSNGVVVGIVGVSGASSEEDHELAEAAAAIVEA